MQVDPIGFEGDPINLYRYCDGNPVNASDPFGLKKDPWEEHQNEVAAAVDNAVRAAGEMTADGSSYGKAGGVECWTGNPVGTPGSAGSGRASNSSAPGAGLDGVLGGIAGHSGARNNLSGGAFGANNSVARSNGNGGGSGPAYDWVWLEQSLRKARPSRAEAESMNRFADFMDEAVGTYSVLALGGLEAGEALAGSELAQKAPLLRVRFGYHGPHHTFGALGRRSHLQLNWYFRGIKGSNRAIRVPIPWR
jgi:hypothetical protein